LGRSNGLPLLSESQFESLGTSFDQPAAARAQRGAGLRVAATDDVAHNNLGIALDKQGQMGEAIRQFQEAIRLKPGYAEAHYNLGLVLGLRGQTAEAIRYFEAVLKAKPDYPEAHNYLGLVFSQQGRTGEAIRQFQEALRLKPDYAEARKNLNVALATQADSSPPPGASTNH